MRIAIFSDNFYPELGGIQDVIIFIAKELGRRGYNIDLYVPEYPAKAYKIINQETKELELGENINIHRLFSIPVPNSTGQSRLVCPTLLRSLNIKRLKPDIIHSHTFLGVGLEALLAAKALKVPFIGTNHFLITEFYYYFPFISRKLFGKVSLRYVVWYYNHCNFVTAPSNYVLKEMINKGLVVGNNTMANPIDLKIFNLGNNNKKSLKKEFGLTTNTIVYAGKLAKEKCIEVIIQSLSLVKKEINDICLAIAGHGSEERPLRNLITKLGLENNVIFLGTLDKEVLAKLYQASEIFVITSTSENQSMVTLQAMACGLPCIGVNWRSMPELINKENGFLVEVGDYKTLARKIICLLKNEVQREKMGSYAFSFAQKFSSKNIANEWEKIYSNVIK